MDYATSIPKLKVFLLQVYYTAVVLMHTNRVKDNNRVTSQNDIVRGIARKVLNIFKTIFK